MFLDRDGVIIQNRQDYVKSWKEVCFLPKSIAALRRLGHSEYAVVMVTNQSVVGRGIITQDQALAINEQVISKIRDLQGRVDASFLCPHAPGDGCDCRKPAPGMLLQAASLLALDLEQSFLVGDSLSDVQAAQAAGARGILVLTGRGLGQASLLKTEGPSDSPVLADLSAAVDHILDEI